jgi:hypothetical protein
MKLLLKLVAVPFTFFLLLLPVFLCAAAESPLDKNEIWAHGKDGCNQGMYKQPNGPMSLILFCDDALDTNIGLVYHDSPEAPISLRFFDRLSETEKETYYKIWSLANRMWQDPIWASDVTSYAWGFDGTKIYVATSGIYGSGAFYELDLVRKKHRQIAPRGKKATINDPGPGYLIEGQEHMIGNPVADLSHVTIPAIQRCAIENLRQVNETLAIYVEPKGVRGYIEIEKATLEFSIFYRGIAH